MDGLAREEAGEQKLEPEFQEWVIWDQIWEMWIRKDISKKQLEGLKLHKMNIIDEAT